MIIWHSVENEGFPTNEYYSLNGKKTNIYLLIDKYCDDYVLSGVFWINDLCFEGSPNTLYWAQIPNYPAK